METATEIAVRAVAAQLAAFEREDAEVSALLTRKCTGASIPYAIRLGPEELAALQRRAAARKMKPTALARALIRAGLRSASPERPVAAVLERLTADLAELSELLS